MNTTETKVRHTPWYHSGDYIYDANEQPVFSLEFGSAEELTARADYVVRAVNSHADMLEALEGLFKHCSMIHKHWGENSNAKKADEAIKFAQAAIAKARSDA